MVGDCVMVAGTPDLRNRFVVGAGSSYAVNATGGSANAVVVSHTHTFSTTSTGNHDTSIRKGLTSELVIVATVGTMRLLKLGLL